MGFKALLTLQAVLYEVRPVVSQGQWWQQLSRVSERGLSFQLIIRLKEPKTRLKEPTKRSYLTDFEKVITLDHLLRQIYGLLPWHDAETEQVKMYMLKCTQNFW